MQIDTNAVKFIQMQWLVTPSVFEPMIFPFKRISDRVVFEMEIN
jgi:hypothetical protein